jgi:hypothetical protein
MRLLEFKILFNMDYNYDSNDVLPLREYVEEVLWYIGQRPDVIHVSKQIILEGESSEKEK